MSVPLLTLEAFAEVALPVPMRTLFDYSVPIELASRLRLSVGMRVKVPFGKGSRIGVIVALKQTSERPDNQLKPLIDSLDEIPVLSTHLLTLCQWASRYYHHPLGEVITHALPVLLRKGDAAALRTETWWFLTPTGQQVPLTEFKQAARQLAFMTLMRQHPNGLSPHIMALMGATTAAAKALEEKGYVRSEPRSFSKNVEHHGHQRQVPPSLNDEQQQAVTRLRRHLDSFHVSLLDGVTGSGKTEVYLRVMEQVIEHQRQVLVMVPEIGLTPQTLKRFEDRFNTDIVLLHSNMSDRERLDGWLMARTGKAKVIIGTRSAIFVPAPNLGLIVIDEEHDASYKQQDGFRFHARDLALVRAKALDIPVILGSATPAYESLANAIQQKFSWLKLRHRAGVAKMPSMTRIDLRGKTLQYGFSQDSLQAMQLCLDRKEQVLVFLNRRGYAPTLMCHDCGWMATCDHCDVNMTVHKRANKLHCHHCGFQKHLPQRCGECDSDTLFTVGEGTEQIESQLHSLFKEVSILRLDRDSTQRKSAMTQITQKIHAHDSAILVGTQMLAKGHHFPNVTLVVVMNADIGLFSADFRGMERTAQLIIQVAGRAGRANKTGHVLLQTYHPDHPAIAQLCTQGYEALAIQGLYERQQLALPPFSHQVIIRAESATETLALALLEQLRFFADAQIQADARFNQIGIVGPYAAIIVRKAGQHRYLLSLKCGQRAPLHALMAQLTFWLEQNTHNHKVRFAIDVDPLETY